jgi:hypothetical protein
MQDNSAMFGADDLMGRRGPNMNVSIGGQFTNMMGKFKRGLF